MPSKRLRAVTGFSVVRRTLQGIALFEAFKGIAGLIVGLGLVALQRHDLRLLVRALGDGLGLSPASDALLVLLHWADVLQHAPLAVVETLTVAYLVLRLTEAYGLWHGRVWAQWLGTLSIGLYIPFELYHLWHVPNGYTATLLLLNILIVAFLARQLWGR